jgi:ABC-type antimicrobial peptide transport system permease subunit
MTRGAPEPTVDGVRELLWRGLATQRLGTTLFGQFALVGLVLVLVGMYGLTAYAVAQRTAEIGVRVAMGAPEGSLIALMMRRGALVAAGGLTLGLAVTFLEAKLIAGFLYGVRATDGLTTIGVSALVLTATLLATYLPARRAARVDPIVALRCE